MPIRTGLSEICTCTCWCDSRFWSIMSPKLSRLETGCLARMTLLSLLQPCLFWLTMAVSWQSPRRPIWQPLRAAAVLVRLNSAAGVVILKPVKKVKDVVVSALLTFFVELSWNVRWTDKQWLHFDLFWPFYRALNVLIVLIKYRYRLKSLFKIKMKFNYHTKV